jgi:peptidylprolyl isomerase
MLLVTFLLFFLSPFLVFAEKETAQEKSYDKCSHENMAKLSETLGHLIGKSIISGDVKYDVAEVLKGLEQCLNGKKSPMTEKEYLEAISSIKEDLFKKLSDSNLKAAEKFLETNKNAPNIHVLEDGKVQFKVDKEGSGTEVVQENSTVLVLYSGSLLDGQVFDSTTEGVVLELDETIEGFKKGLVGMKEGEKRVVYMHPDFGYGTNFPLSPNGLLTFNVEIVKINPTLPIEKQTTIPEIADPLQEYKVIN